MGDFIKTWVGEASAWQCDDLGHLNMRHYMTKASEAREMFIIRLGLETAFMPETSSTVRVEDFHIKYMNEARPGDPLYIETGILDISDARLTLCHMMFHADGRQAATILETVAHISISTERAFNWPQRVLSAAPEFHVEMPESAKPRNIAWGTDAVGPDQNTMERWGVKPIGMGVFQSPEMDIGGVAKPEAFMGRTTETVASFKEGWEELQDQASRDAGLLGALLEMRGFIHKPARTGEPYMFYSGVESVNTYTRTIVHNLINPLNGQSYCSMIAAGCLFDLNTRRLVKATPEQVAKLQTNVIKGLTA